MAWTDPTTQPTGHIVTASEWNTQVVANLEYLRTHGGGMVANASADGTNSTSYTQLAPSDIVQGIELPSNGLLCIAYQALWKESVASAARAAIFINSNQLRIGRGLNASPDVQECGIGGTANFYVPLASSGVGLDSVSAGTADATEVTTGQLVAAYEGSDRQGGVAYVFAAAGTYDISIQFKTSSGTVTAKNRHLWVWVQPFSL